MDARGAPEADLCWREFAIVAKALADGHDMTEIGLMRDIALRTIAVHSVPCRRPEFLIVDGASGPDKAIAAV